MTYVDPDPETETETLEDDEGHDLRNLRRKAKEADRLEKRNAELETKARKLAFIEAGVDVSTPVGALFARAYDGDIEDTEAIKAAYAELGGATSSTEDESPDAAELEATRERQALGGAGAAGDTGEQPRQPVRGRDGAAVKAGRKAMEDGLARDDAMGVTFGELVGAAAEGDQTVILPFGGQEQPQ